MEKKSPKYWKDKNLTKDGIHIMMPFLYSNPKLQFAVDTSVSTTLK